MTSIHETAYPRFKPDLTQRELDEIYTPNETEQRFARRLGRSNASRLYLMILLKTVQRLGYFPMVADVPPSIVSFVTKALGLKLVPLCALVEEEKSRSRRDFIDAIRAHLKIHPITKDTDKAIELAATQAAQTKQELADIINVIIEELIRQRYELPAFSRLNRTAFRIRNLVNEQYFHTLSLIHI